MSTHPPIIDSHIHLYPSSALDTLAWCPSSHPLYAQHSVEDYLASTSSSHSSPDPANEFDPDPSLHGFIFIEADRKSSLHPTCPSTSTPTSSEQHQGYGWEYALLELAFAAGIHNGADSNSTTHAPLLLGIVPWAPIPLGSDGMSTYVSRARATVGKEAWGLVKGFRYLVQDKPPGTMLEEKFVEGVRWCGREEFVFELGVDARGAGGWQLEEGVGFLGRVYAGLDVGGGRERERVVVTIGMWTCTCLEGVGVGPVGRELTMDVWRWVDHMCKPDMRSDDADAETRDAIFAEWDERIKQFASFPQTYMKLSGAFSEIPPLPAHDDARPWFVTPELRAAKSRIAPWVAAVFRAFGPERIMFGSDWPVCNLGGGGRKVAWRNWRWVVEEMLRDLGLSEDEKRAIWGGTAARAYKIS